MFVCSERDPRPSPQEKCWPEKNRFNETGPKSSGPPHTHAHTQSKWRLTCSDVTAFTFKSWLVARAPSYFGGLGGAACVPVSRRMLYGRQ